ncbi:MAG: hypothetical protein ACFFE8_13960 [Candidatus Heimdallarchaeota archaeon]
MPEILIPASQTSNSPEYNDTNSVSILAFEPSDASGIDAVWLNYTYDDWLTSVVEDITSTQSFTFAEEMLQFGQTYRWIIGFNDSAGNSGYSDELIFTVVDNHGPDVIQPATQTTFTPEFNGSVVVSIGVSEPSDASGLKAVWLHYTTDNWFSYSVINVTSTQSFSFSPAMLEYGQIYQLTFRYEDMAGNSRFSNELSFSVIDTYSPDVLVPPAQSTDSPLYNSSVSVSITVIETQDAAGIDMVWINYTIDNWLTYNLTIITATQFFTFTEDMLRHGQIYYWKIGYNDTAGNQNFGNELFFIVEDIFPPEVIIAASQSTSSPEYNSTVLTSISIAEPEDAAGIDMVWINYTTDNWLTVHIVDITQSQSYLFADSGLEFGQTYNWQIAYNDSVGNTAYSSVFSFTVIDSYKPDVEVDAFQSVGSPNYNESVDVAIIVSEPPDASGLDTVWLNYTFDDWLSYTILDITATQGFTFDESMLEYGQLYRWQIYYNDTEGNMGVTEELIFSVMDKFAPDVNSGSFQSTTYPEFNGSVFVSINVSEPADSAGLDNVWLNYTTDNWTLYTTVDISSGQAFTFTDTTLIFDQTYQWVIGYNDTVGNTAYSDELVFNVVDSYAPDVTIPPYQSTPNPGYNESVTIAITVSEPIDAAGVSNVWINYTQNDWTSFSFVNITSLQSFTFTDVMLTFGQAYRWVIGFNDTQGNTAYSEEFSFIVTDGYAPDIIVPAQQSLDAPEFNDTVGISITIDEPIDAAGVHMVWLNYTFDDWITYSISDITSTQTFTFTEEMLHYGQSCKWRILSNDTVGNIVTTGDFLFSVIDTYSPDIVVLASQNTSIPQYNESVTASITVSEPFDASGLDMVWINYTLDNWLTFNVFDVTLDQSFSFSEALLEYDQTYSWKIGFNDTAGNVKFSVEKTFQVLDSYAPDIVSGPVQIPFAPNFNESLVVSISVVEPLDAAGLANVWIYYTSDNWSSYTVVDITTTQVFTFSDVMYEYGQIYQWKILYKDILNNEGVTNEFNFIVIDEFAPDVMVQAEQTTNSPEFNDTVIVSIFVDESDDASGVDTIWLNYTVDKWLTYTVVNITQSQTFVFAGEMLEFNQTYNWIIGYNDSAGNAGKSSEFSFLVGDSFAPDIEAAASQSSSSPQFNGTLIVSIAVIEPIDASGVHKIWLNYTNDDWGTHVVVDITSTQSYTFNDALLRYGQIYYWLIGFNDSVGNVRYTNEFMFTVVDSFKPDVISPAHQSTTIPQFNESVLVAINVSEPLDAAGINKVWINYTTDNWITSFVADIGQSQSFNFTADMLVFGQLYQWIIGYNDSLGNTGFSLEFSFLVIDNFAPDIEQEPVQTASTPEYDDTNIISISVVEPADASGISSVLFYYRVDSGIWQVEDVTISRNFAFTPDMLSFGQTYDWYFRFNDTVGNYDQSNVGSFLIVDNTSPTYSDLNQTSSTPEYSESNNVSVVVSEPPDASGIDTILLFYRINSGAWNIEDVTTTSNYTFTADMLSYGQVYDWYFWFNDTAGNGGQSSIVTFTVVDNTAMEYSGLNQTTPTPSYNGSNTVSVNVHEPANASGIDRIFLYYRINSGAWNIEDVTTTSNYTFTADVFSYGQEFTWYFWFNDTAGNNDQTLLQVFNVIDPYSPEIAQNAIQSTNTPQYNGSVLASISVSEPQGSSGVDTVWINYTDDNWMTFTVMNITKTQSYVFNDEILVFNQVYRWIIGFNDTAGNVGFSEELSFVVLDSYLPDVIGIANQSTSAPEYNSSVVVSISVAEPADASGIAIVWINYTLDGWQSNFVVPITPSQSYTFTEDILEYNQAYSWIIGFNDTVGNTGYSEEYTFHVIDSFKPTTVIPALQSTSDPEYNESVSISILVYESADASGIGKVWINYSLDDWESYTFVDITQTQSFTFNEENLAFNLTYRWFIGYNDSAGNVGYSHEQIFTVTDGYAPDVLTPAFQSSSFAEYNGTLAATILVNESIDASGLAVVWINYSFDDWTSYIIFDITQGQSFVFTQDLLEYGKIYRWVIGFNDTAGNADYSEEYSFLVVDSYAPDVETAASQSTSNPEFNGTVVVSINVTEAIDASGVDTVWINYTSDNWNTFSFITITATQSFTFTENMLRFNQEYRWIIGCNDSAGNIGKTSEFYFFVVDSYAPDVLNPADQTTISPEFNGTVMANITVIEPTDASGLDSVWLTFTNDNWLTSRTEDITEFQSFLFNDSLLQFNQTYHWFIGFNDTVGNVAFSDTYTFLVIDSFKPDITQPARQAFNTPEYNQSNMVDIVVSEPPDASGIDTILLFYRIDSGTWNIEDVTTTSTYTFTADMLSYGQVYDWYFWFNDSAGNVDQTKIQWFNVIDSFDPLYSDLEQTSPTPQYNETNIISITIGEPSDASGVKSILFYYRVNFDETWITVDVTSTSQFAFTADDLEYGQVYDWYFVFDDLAGNSAQTPTKTFSVSDQTRPRLSQPYDITASEYLTWGRLTWKATDVYPDSFEIYQNGLLVDSGSWNGLQIGIDLMGLPEGNHNFTLVVFDKANNKATDVVLINAVKSFIPPPIGDLVIENHTIYLQNESLALNGNLLIKGNGSLTLRGSTLELNSTFDGQYRIEVYRGGFLAILNNSIVTSSDIQETYYLKAAAGSLLSINGSTIMHAGFASRELSGLYINTDKAQVINSFIRNNYIGLTLNNVAYCTIINNTFENNYLGILAENADSCLIAYNIIRGSSNFGILLNKSRNITLNQNHIYNIVGEPGADGITSSESGTTGSMAVGIHLMNSSENLIINNVIDNIIGGSGGTGGGFSGSGGTGGISAGIFLESSSGNIFANNGLGIITGGAGGSSGDLYGSGGSGGVGTGILLLDSINNSFRLMSITDIQGGLGGNGGSEYGSEGSPGSSYGVFFESGSYQNEFESTVVMEGDPVLYMYGQSNLVVEDFNISANVNPTNLGKIVVINCYNVSIRNNILSNFYGVNGITGDYFTPGTKGERGTAIYLLNSFNVIIERNIIKNIMGGSGGTGGYRGSGGTGGEAAAIFLESSAYNIIRNNTIMNMIGGKGGEGGRLGSGGPGGKATGTYLRNSSDNFFLKNAIISGEGGSGGSGGYHGSGGQGGTAAGIYFENSIENLIENNSFANLIGGVRGLAEIGNSHGTDSAGFGVYFEADSYKNHLEGNLYDGDLVIYLYGQKDLIFENLNLTSPNNPTNLGKIVLIDCYNITIRRNNISFYYGVGGGTGNSLDPGDLGGLGVGIYLFNSSFNFIGYNILTDITGGMGGTGGWLNAGGKGGSSIGIYLVISSFNTFDFNVMMNIKGGIGGKAGYTGVNGTGGDSIAVYMVNSSYNSITAVISELVGGDGNAGGSQKNIVLSEDSKNNFWAYESTSKREYDENQTIYFGLDEHFDNDTLIIYYRVDNGSWSTIDTSGTQNYTFTSELFFYQQFWEWFFWFNVTSGQNYETGLLSFKIIDTKPKLYTEVFQTNSTINYFRSNTVSIIIEEPEGSSEVDTILLYYQLANDSWNFIDVTSGRNFTFLADQLIYGQVYHWYFWINDTAGNTNRTGIYSFSIVDNTAPYYSNLVQTNESIEYDGINFINVSITEPTDGSGVDTVLLYYRLDNDSWIIVDVTDGQNYTFTEKQLVYGQNYGWYFWFNDTAGNSGQTEMNSFSVVDSKAPIVTNISFTGPTIQYTESVHIEIDVMELPDASGVDTILLYYSLNDNWTIKEITLTRNYTFAENVLRYGQLYSWFIWYNDSVGNFNKTQEESFYIVDLTPPLHDVQTYGVPEYNKDYTVSVLATEPGDASGMDSILFYFFTNHSTGWKTSDITETGNFTFREEDLIFNQTYFWYYWLADRAGNTNQSRIFNFTVTDLTPPSYSDLTQDSLSPAYNESNTVRADIYEPLDACGLDSIYIFYREDNQSWQKTNITETQEYTFDEVLLMYGQLWEWYLWFNDTMGNYARTPVANFTVEDYYYPEFADVTQSKTIIYAGENNTVSLSASEPIDASGLEKILLYYSQNQISWSIIDITHEQRYSFQTNELLNGTYFWYFEILDRAGNQISTPTKSFEVVVTDIDLSPIISLGVLSSLIMGTFALAYAYGIKKRR